MDTITRIRKPIEAELERYRQAFDTCLMHPDDYLGTALKYVSSRVGKMMRPMLVLLVAKEFGPVGEKSIRSAVTLELLHTASLIHDDVIDDSNERRGKASLHTHFGNKVAILVGDYMLSLALRESAKISDVKIVDIIASLGGILSEGEIRQLANIRQSVATEEAYYDVIQRKTAALFEACAKLGAMSSGASDFMIQKASVFADKVGMCFQIRDDIFDYFPSKEIGKPTGNDMMEGKLTLPAIYAINQTDSEEVKGWAMHVKQGVATTSEIDNLVRYTIDNGGIDYAEKRMLELRNEALQALDFFSNEQIKEALNLYLDFTIQRQS